MSFSLKAGNGGDNTNWSPWNEHLLEQIGKIKPRVAVLSGIIDVGTQEQEPARYDWEDTPQQREKLETVEGCHLDGNEIVIPRKPAPSIVMMADFPETLVDYGKHPYSESKEENWQPYRHLITNEFKGCATPCPLTHTKKTGVWAYDVKHRVSQIASAADLCDGVAPQDFDLGELLGAVFTMELGAVRNGEYINVKAKTISKKHEAIPVPKHDIQPFGILMNGENDPEDVKMIRKSIKTLLAKSPDYEGSLLKQQIESNGDNGDKPKQAAKKAPAKKAAPKKAPAPEPDYDDDTPW